MLTAFFAAVMLIPFAAAQTPTSPAEYLGYELGDRFTPHHQIVGYFRQVAEESDRVQMITYGRTNEGRELVLAFVSSPGNLARLEEIREDNLRRARLMDGTPGEDGKAIVWLSYNVHGNESNSSEAALATLYRLADSAHEAAEWLENTVVILDPAINPDGRDRYVNWYNMVVGKRPDADPVAAEHREPWPGGRTNHYYFDLNRDWSWQTQVETQQRLKPFLSWMPHVHVDFHEQGVDSPYFFAPAAEPLHEEVTPWQRSFQETIGRNHARYFDREGWLYFTKESFDILYPGYGDSFPMFNGAIGMTYEQAGGGRAGLGIQTTLADTLTLLDRLTHHMTTSLSTVEVTSQHADAVLEAFGAYFDRAVTDPPGAYEAYVVRRNSKGQRVEALVEHLDRLDIRYASAASSAQVRGMDYRSGATGRHAVQQGDLVIPAAQPRAVLTRVLFDPEVVLSDTLTYDITGWALPYIYDVEAVASTEPLSVQPWTAKKTGGVVEVDWADEPYAWVAAWDDPADAEFLAALMSEGIIVRRNDVAFRVGTEAFDRGAVIITRRNNEGIGENLPHMLDDLAREHHQRLVPLKTGFVDEGTDLGSGRVRAVQPVRVGMPYGPAISSNGLGEVWHYFDQVLDYPLTRFPAADFGSMDLSEFDVLIMPSGSYSSILGGEGLGQLSSWIRDGGRLVAIEGAATWLAGKDGFSIKMETPAPEADTLKERRAREQRWENRSRDRAPDINPGAIYRVRIDDSHPLGFGFAEESFVLRRRDDGPQLLTKSGSWNVGLIQEDGRMSGHTGYRAETRIEGSLAFGVESLGRGEVVYLLDNPLFRGFLQSGRMLFANAVFMAGK
ncbi:MAG: M14 family metallopeptidase [Bacteroidota bacterium]|nr:M14 family metallopeptidase [Bacteroidota bacterium]